MASTLSDDSSAISNTFSNLTDLLTTELEQPQLMEKQTKRVKSDIWMYNYGQSSTHWKCKICWNSLPQKSIEIRKKYGTSAVRRHLLTQHKVQLTTSTEIR